MDILESVKMATTTLLANKLRSSLTMLGIIIGNASVIAMIGIGEGAQTLATKQFESLGPNTLFIVPGSPGSRGRVTAMPRTLVLQDAELTNNVTKFIEECIIQNSSLEILDISLNNFSFNGICGLIEKMKFNKSLKQLNFSNAKGFTNCDNQKMSIDKRIIF